MSGRSVTKPHCSCRASLPNADYQYLVPILSPVTDNLLFLNQRKSYSDKHSTKECAGNARVDLVTVDTRRPSYLVRFSVVCNMKINEELNGYLYSHFTGRRK